MQSGIGRVVMVQKVIPESKRNPNKVDDLLLQVNKFQSACRHDFRSLGVPELEDSLVEGTYVCHKASMTIRGIIPSSTLRCIDCSVERIESIEKVCPFCLGDMKMGQLHVIEPDGEDSRVKYFGDKYIYYSVRLRHCWNCNFTIACDEWNQ